MFDATSEKEFPLKGYSLPLSPKGKTSIVDAPPWYYGGEVLCLTLSPTSGSTMISPWLGGLSRDFQRN
jgi:hypothetical protein